MAPGSGADTATLVVDQQFSLVADPVQYTLEARDMAAQELPMDDTLTFTQRDDFDPGDPLTWNIASVTATAGTILHLTFDGAPDTFVVQIAKPDLSARNLCNGCSDFDQHVTIDEDIQYLLFITNQDVDPGGDLRRLL